MSNRGARSSCVIAELDMSRISPCPVGLQWRWSKPERRLLRTFRRPDLDAFQVEHPNLGYRAARSRKSTDLAAGGQDPVTGNDQRYRIAGHGSTYVARSLWPTPELPG